jgi:hypothetical protein
MPAGTRPRPTGALRTELTGRGSFRRGDLSSIEGEVSRGEDGTGSGHRREDFRCGDLSSTEGEVALEASGDPSSADGRAAHGTDGSGLTAGRSHLALRRKLAAQELGILAETIRRE